MKKTDVGRLTPSYIYADPCECCAEKWLPGYKCTWCIRRLDFELEGKWEKRK